jgi:hypothetical protein
MIPLSAIGLFPFSLIESAKRGFGCLIQLRDGRIATTHHHPHHPQNNVIIIRDVDSLETNRIVLRPQSQITFVKQLRDGRIASGQDLKRPYGCIMFWELSTNSEHNIITVGTPICMLQLRNGHMIYGSDTGFIGMLTETDILLSRKIHEGVVNDLIEWEGDSMHNCILSVGSDGNIIVMTRELVLIKNIQWNENLCSAIQLDASCLLVGTRFGFICEVDMHTEKRSPFEYIDGHRIDYLTRMPNGQIFSSSRGGGTFTWDTDTKKPHFVSHSSYIAPIHTRDHINEARVRLYSVLQDYIIHDLKHIVFDYMNPVEFTDT